MRRLFELRPWHKLVPDQSVIAAGQGEGRGSCPAARAEDGSFVIAYVPAGKPISIHMDKLSGKEIRPSWYDPRDGTWREIGDYANTGRPRVRRPLPKGARAIGCWSSTTRRRTIRPNDLVSACCEGAAGVRFTAAELPWR